MIHTFENNIDVSIQNALLEDLGSVGDVTSQYSIDEQSKSKAKFVVKEIGIVAGAFLVKRAVEILDPEITWQQQTNDGVHVNKGTVIAQIEGATRSILAGERVSLNFLQRMSGIATLTSRYVNEVQPYKAKILDTRKTVPGLRAFDKLAVKLGGGENHRFGLFDMVLVKDNHIAASGSVGKALERVFENEPKVPVEVEVTSLSELITALSFPVDRIMLDNMSPKLMSQAVEIANGKVPLEASGGITLLNVKEVAQTGVDYISVGALTHSAKALDISLEIEKK